MKSFVEKPGTDLLTLESNIYEYIKLRNTQITDEFKDNFINLITVFKIKMSEFRSIYSSTQNTDLTNNCNYSAPDVYTPYCDGATYGDEIYFIITEDSDSIEFTDAYLDIFEKFRSGNDYEKKDLRDELMGLIFELVYGLYLLNDRLNIIHNDNHFGNILVKKVSPREKTYTVGTLKFKAKSRYIVKIYDFDRSFYPNDKDLILERFFTPYAGPGNTTNYIVGRSNLSDYDKGRDINTLGNSFYFFPLVRYKIYASTDPLHSTIINTVKSLLMDNTEYNIFNLLFGFDSAIIDNFEDIFDNNGFVDLEVFNVIPFWNSYCYFGSKDCMPIDDVDYISPEKVLERLLGNKEVVDLLGINNVNPLFKKYLKYKIKYLKLKEKKKNLLR